jgi:putative ABC transport system permease protein
MFFRLVKGSMLGGRRRKLAAAAAVAIGAAVAASMLALALGIRDKVNRELRAYGANIEVLPRQRSLTIRHGDMQYRAAAPRAYLEESQLPRLKSIFWANNILDFAPFLSVPVKVRAKRAALVGTWFERELKGEDGHRFRVGVKSMNRWWELRGSWPGPGECLVGVSLRDKLEIKIGDLLTIEHGRPDGSSRAEQLSVSGFLRTGSDEDESLVTDLEIAQRLAGLEGKIERLEVSALTAPEDDFARRDLATMSPEELERWSCTPYARSIARNIEEALDGSEARPVLKISQAEGRLLERIELMMLLITVAALAASALGISSTMMTTVLERRSEIGLLKAMGASNLSVAAIFLAESVLIGCLGGALGLGLGYGLAELLARSVFGSAIEWSSAVAPLVLVISIGVAFAGSAMPLRAALGLEPAAVLRGE